MTSARSNGTHKHVAVIGAGTVGTCCAWSLIKKGYEVTLIDPELPGQTTSYGNAGCLSTSHITPFSYPGVSREIPGWLFDPLGPLFIRWSDFPRLAPWLWKFWRAGNLKKFDWSTQAQTTLMNRAIDDFAGITTETGTAHFIRRQGAISFFDSRDEFDKEGWKYKIKEELGFDWQILSPSEVKIMVPELELGKGVAVFNPDWEHTINPGAMTAAIAEAGFSAGGHWLQDRVSEVQASERAITLNTESGKRIEADTLVVAAGVWSNQFAGRLDFKVPLAPKRGYHSMIGSPGISLDYPVMSMSSSFVMTPMQEGLRLAGTAEFPTVDAEPDYRRAKILLQHAKRYLPDLQFEDVSEWMGQRPMMSDNIPVICPSPSHGNVFYAFGHGHYGLTQGPTTGKIIAALVAGEEPEFDLTDYHINRFRR
jgi:D-amino-acid dehydrogenase